MEFCGTKEIVLLATCMQWWKCQCSARALLFARALDRIVKLPVVEGSFLVVSVAVSAVVSELSDGLLYSYSYCVCYR